MMQVGPERNVATPLAGDITLMLSLWHQWALKISYRICCLSSNHNRAHRNIMKSFLLPECHSHEKALPCFWEGLGTRLELHGHRTYPLFFESLTEAVEDTCVFILPTEAIRLQPSLWTNVGGKCLYILIPGNVISIIRTALNQ